jgi:hypothetical protein
MLRQRAHYSCEPNVDYPSGVVAVVVVVVAAAAGDDFVVGDGYSVGCEQQPNQRGGAIGAPANVAGLTHSDATGCSGCSGVGGSDGFGVSSERLDGGDGGDGDWMTCWAGLGVGCAPIWGAVGWKLPPMRTLRIALCRLSC